MVLSIPAAHAQLTVLHNFLGGSDGANPGFVILDSSGNLYGTTIGGGNDACVGGCGTIYRIEAQSNDYATIDFDNINGNFPNGPLARDARGDLFGTAYIGGTSNLGTVFEATAPGGRILSYSFPSGGEPVTGVVLDSRDNAYGTTTLGGALNNGSIFRLTPDGAYSEIYSFNAPTDGDYPTSITMDSSGTLYGTNGGGGLYGEGTIFSLDRNGKFTVLYSFTGGTDGGYPVGPLLIDVYGNVYGVAESSGSLTGGLIFKVTPNGNETVLYTFGLSDGFPNGGLVADPKGDLYGTTFGSGGEWGGEVFELTPSKGLVVLYSFGNTDGYAPGAGLARDSSGTLYGTTVGGGGENCYDGTFQGCGTVFKLVPPNLLANP